VIGTVYLCSINKMPRRASRKSGQERQRRTRKQRGGAGGEPTVNLPVRRYPLLSGHAPTPLSELGGVSPVPSGQRRLQRGVAGRHLNRESYLSEASKAAANKAAANKAAANKAAANKAAANERAAKKATRRAKLALEKTRVGFKETVTASNKTEGTLANNRKRFGDGTQQFSTLQRYEGLARKYGPLEEVHDPKTDEKPDYEIFDKGLWSTSKNKAAATAEMREEMRGGKMYVNMENDIRSRINYSPTPKNRQKAARLNATRRAANAAQEAANLNATRRAANAAQEAANQNAMRKVTNAATAAPSLHATRRSEEAPPRNEDPS
jgi:hypothetical protein